MKKYKVIFKFLNDLRELKNDYLDNDGKVMSWKMQNILYHN